MPRGFSRFYALTLLKEQPMTGKQIMESAARESDGMWKPSAGLVYPLLGRLLQEELIEETKDGKYSITKKGIDVLGDLQSIQDVVKKQLDVLMRVGNVGRFIAMDVLDKVTSMGTVLSENFDRMTETEKDKYRKFLVSELKKIEEKEGKQKIEVE
ncbi:MAG: PadR family transcriptional regulator [Nitrososphaerales archaeon]